MNTEKFVKLQALEGGNYSPLKNIVTFDLPQGATYDLSESYMIFNINPNIQPYTIDGANNITGLVPYYITHTRCENQPDEYDSAINGMLIRNSRIQSERVGRLEDIRNSNIIFNELAQWTKSFDEKLSYNYMAMTPNQTNFNILNAQMLKLNKTGDVVSDLSKPFQWQVPLSECLMLGNVKALNTSKMGKVRIQVELDLENIVPRTYMTLANDLEGDDNNLSFGGAKNRGMEDVNFGDDLTILTTIEPLGVDLSESPYFVGQSITISATGVSSDAGTAAPADIVDQPNVISEITLITDPADANVGCLQLTLGNALPDLLANQGYDNIIIAGGVAPPDNYFGDFEFSNAEMRLKQIPDVPMDELNYLTISNESDNGNGLLNFKKQYYAEPNAVALLVSLTTGKLRSDGARLQYYRIQVDGKDVTGNRDVVNFKSLEFELLNKTLLNLGMPLKDAMPRTLTPSNEYYSLNGYATTSGGDNQLTFIGCPLPQTPINKLIDLEIEAQPAEVVQDFELFKFLVKGVKL